MGLCGEAFFEACPSLIPLPSSPVIPSKNPDKKPETNPVPTP
jgi:hypothetical protein